VDGLGNLARRRLSAGQAADVREAEPLPAGIAAGSVAADNADDGDALIETITAGGAEAVIPRAPTVPSSATSTAISIRDAT
jgi:hypothetical protein